MGSWTHRPEKRAASKQVRRSWFARIAAEVAHVMRSRAIDRRAKVDDFGETYWPDSEQVWKLDRQ